MKSKTFSDELKEIAERSRKTENLIHKVIYDSYDHVDKLQKLKKMLIKTGNAGLVRKIDEILLDYAERIEETGELMKKIE